MAAEISETTINNSRLYISTPPSLSRRLDTILCSVQRCQDCLYVSVASRTVTEAKKYFLAGMAGSRVLLLREKRRKCSAAVRCASDGTIGSPEMDDASRSSPFSDLSLWISSTALPIASKGIYRCYAFSGKSCWYNGPAKRARGPRSLRFLLSRCRRLVLVHGLLVSSTWRDCFKSVGARRSQ
jgi:hypothetical protein